MFYLIKSGNVSFMLFMLPLFLSVLAVYRCFITACYRMFSFTRTLLFTARTVSVFYVNQLDVPCIAGSLRIIILGAVKEACAVKGRFWPFTPLNTAPTPPPTPVYTPYTTPVYTGYTMPDHQHVPGYRVPGSAVRRKGCSRHGNRARFVMALPI